MISIACTLCGKRFAVKPSRAKRGHGTYCSAACLYAAQRRRITVTCYICKKEIYKTPSQLKKSRSKEYFCGKSCQAKWRNAVFAGPLHRSWKNGATIYRRFLQKQDVPQACLRCGTKDRRVLAVHHLDGNHT